MKKVFIIHGFNSNPNSSWLPWLMGELKRQEIYAGSLIMPNPAAPVCLEWTNEISRHVLLSPEDDIYLVGYSLGSAAILNFLQSSQIEKRVKGTVLVSGRCIKSNNPLTANFYESFDWEKINSNSENFFVIHGDNDDRVPVENAFVLSKNLNIEPLIIENGGHLTGSEGWLELPACLQALNKMFVN
jgi:uncharacterized protein